MRGRPRAPVPLLAVLCVLVALAVATGCERRAQGSPDAASPAATLVASADYGGRELLATRVFPGQSVMRALRSATPVRTAHAGGFVTEMLGLSSDASAARDWFFFVDGIGSSVGAKDVRVRAGQTIWWDHRNWGGLPMSPAVVGAWPAPLVVAGTGPRPVQADPPLRAALASAGADLTDSPSPWRARVGSSSELAGRDAAWRRALADPDAAGLTITIRKGAIVALGVDGRTRTPVAGARALVAAVPTAVAPENGVLVVVAGLDRAAADAAARRVATDPGVLRLRYAVAFDGAGHPLVAGGRSTP